MLNEHRIKNDCIITGLKVGENISALEAVVNISKDIGVSLETSAVDDAYFFRNKNNEKKTMVVKFASKVHKEKFMTSRSKLKDKEETKKVFISHFNSKETINLFNHAKSLKSIGCQYVFIKNGNVFCKKSEISRQQIIHNEDEVDEILLKATTNKHCK